jgi:hypothetical protein
MSIYNPELEKQIDKAIVEAKKKPKVSLPIEMGMRLTSENKTIMEAARRLADK